jgi:hypothetical protein
MGSESYPLWSFPPSATLTRFPTPGCWACAAAPTFPGQARLVYLQFREGFSSPSPLFGTQGAPPSLVRFFIVLIAYYSVSVFFPGWGLICPGGYADLAQGCLWEYHVPLSSPCGPCLPKPPGRGCLAAAQGPSWFLRLCEVQMALHRLEVWRGQSFASSRWPCL